MGALTGTLRYSGVTHGSLVNGPGVRNVLHLQGCTIGCNGCFNTHTWSKEGGKESGISSMVSELLKGCPERLTVSGGEPTEQWEAVKKLLKECHMSGPDNLNVLMFTGLTEEQLVADGILSESFEECPGSQALISTIVCGPYDRDNPSDSYLLGSTNQKILTWNGVPLPVEDGPRFEIHVGKDGKIKVTGFPNRNVIKAIKQNFTKEK